ncbi:MAG: DUF1800 domain-containing protein [Vulcanimicrobiota bacterium]
MPGRTLILLFTFWLLAALPGLAELPYAEHGWSKEEASAHLLSRFTYGPRPGEVDRVARLGLEEWLLRQLEGSKEEPLLKQKLAQLPAAYALSNNEILKLYPRPGQVFRMAQEEGLWKAGERPDREALKFMLEQKGLRPFTELDLTLFAQKLLHARHSENALREVMTEFWFNHFNVSLSNNRARPFILSYERDVLRPNALDNFRTLLGSTAKHPAMLLYLDNANSSASLDTRTTLESRMEELSVAQGRIRRSKERIRKRKKGLNENYARELMELHTLGVDGGYNQDDVIQVARAFTGWTVLGRQARMNPPTAEQKERRQAVGIHQEGDFRFAAAIHDAEPKTILGQDFPAGGGVEEGERVLDLLSAHPSTARHLARKLAVRFISDEPDAADIQKVARAFQDSRGDISATLLAVARTDGFWDPANRYSKVKSPFELVVSANRALDGDLYPSRHLYGWLARMGQPLYNYQAPTGFPDRAEFWVSSASVLNRVNFALQAATGGISGFTYSPGQEMDLQATVRRLLPYRDSVDSTTQNIRSMLSDSPNLQLEAVNRFEVRPNMGGQLPGTYVPVLTLKKDQKESALMIGLILGTPEFQRR